MFRLWRWLWLWLFRLSSFVFSSSKFQTRGANGFFTLHSSLFTLKTLHSSLFRTSLFTFRTANKVQGERRAELARAMLSRSLYSLLQLVCESKVTKNHWRKYQLWYTYVHLWYTYDTLTCSYVQLDALMRAPGCLNGVETLQECQRSAARMTERKCKDAI